MTNLRIVELLVHNHSFEDRTLIEYELSHSVDPVEHGFIMGYYNIDYTLP